MAFGLLLMAAALFLTCFNCWDARRAGRASAEVAESLKLMITSGKQSAESANYSVDYSNDDMPVIEVDGRYYIGILEIPSLDLALPVMQDWDYEKMKISPCRYNGSYYTDDLVIAGHNYISHFSPLKWIDIGSEVYFTNTEGQVYRYIVDNVETLQPTQVEAMITGDWDLTLFTCTTGGASRCTVRCVRMADNESYEFEENEDGR